MSWYGWMWMRRFIVCCSLSKTGCLMRTVFYALCPYLLSFSALLKAIHNFKWRNSISYLSEFEFGVLFTFLICSALLSWSDSMCFVSGVVFWITNDSYAHVCWPHFSFNLALSSLSNAFCTCCFCYLVNVATWFPTISPPVEACFDSRRLSVALSFVFPSMGWMIQLPQLQGLNRSNAFAESTTFRTTEIAYL